MRPPRKKGQGILLDETRSQARQSGANGTKRRFAGSLVMVEGESVSLQAIAERVGIAETTAGRRLKAAQQSDGPVTWAKLEGKG